MPPTGSATGIPVHHASRACNTNAQPAGGHDVDGDASPLSSKGDSLNTRGSTPQTSISSAEDAPADAADVGHYIPLGCLHYDHQISYSHGPKLEPGWRELIYSDIPDEVRHLIGMEALKLLSARWIRMFLLELVPSRMSPRSLVRVYLLPWDWARARTSIDRGSKTLKKVLRSLLEQIDTSLRPWNGDVSEGEITHFDPWATAEPASLYYLFNKLPSPDPHPDTIKSRYARAAAQDLLKSAAYSEWEEFGEQPLPGLRTRLYPYQARAAALMMQREAQPSLQLDPRLEVRTSPSGKNFFFAPRDGSFLQAPVYYEASRGGILAESMGLGKTLICLAVILATKGHLPQIPTEYQPSPPIRTRVGTLADMAAATMGRHAVPARSYIEQSEANNAVDLGGIREVLDRNIPYYEIPAVPLRISRVTRSLPPRQLVQSAGTIIVVPRNLLHQWQSEIQKHVLTRGLKVLVVDTEPKRGSKSKVRLNQDDGMELVSSLPPPSILMTFDVILFTRNRFEMEILDGEDDRGKGTTSDVTRACDCAYVGVTRLLDCDGHNTAKVNESPLKKFHWLRMIIDEGHSFSNAGSNAVHIAKQIQVERRWVVSGTPARNLVGVEIDVSTLETDDRDAAMLRDSTIEQRRSFVLDNENTKAVKALGSLASNFLMVRPWCESGSEGKHEWEDYIYRHEHQYKKTYTAFSSCFLRILEGLVVKTRPDDVEKDIILPPMRHRTVYLQPCWFDKMIANLFIQVLRANAITSERADVDYLFHKNSSKARRSLIGNLRQSNFTWTGFTLDDVVSTLETSSKYLSKEDKNCSEADVHSLFESSQVISMLTTSEEWKSLSRAHEVGMAIDNWPKDHVDAFALTDERHPLLIGVTQLVAGQRHVDSHILASDPTLGLDSVGHTVKVMDVALAEADQGIKTKNQDFGTESLLPKLNVSTSWVGSPQPQKPSSTLTSNPLGKGDESSVGKHPQDSKSTSPVRPRKRKLTLSDEMATLPDTSPLRETQIVGTTSAKLTYLLDKVVGHHVAEKILIFYDGDNAAFYIAQCLEMLYINHRIYARTLDNITRSEYVRLFNEDPDVRVLLIDVACGALGLNLNAASIVLIVNPINRPFLEAQAIKRAHRIGQTKPVTVETLVLENTIEHAIFDRARKMSHVDHQEVKELEDDAGIVDIIQNASILPVSEDESIGIKSYALLKQKQQVFGRTGREKYHRYGGTEAKTNGSKPSKKARTTKKAKKEETEDNIVVQAPAGASQPGTVPTAASSIFGSG